MGSSPTSRRSSSASIAEHPAGAPWGPATETCGSCAWSYLGGPGPKVWRCRASGERIERAWRACERWEREPDCLDCAACCGPAYHAVEVGRRDPVRQKRPGWVVERDGRFEVPRREGNFCSALGEGN